MKIDHLPLRLKLRCYLQIKNLSGLNMLSVSRTTTMAFSQIPHLLIGRFKASTDLLQTQINRNSYTRFFVVIVFLPADLFFGDFKLLMRLGEDIPLSLIESCAEEALPVASLSRIMLS